VVFCLAHASPVAAQDGTALNATVAGLGCNTAKGADQFSVLSFSWGASNPVTLGPPGISSGKASISSFNVMKSFDGCSPALFGGTVKGSRFPTLTMVQLDKKNVVLMTVTLSDVIVESIQWSGSAGGGPTTESVSFAFAKACIQDAPSGSKLCYDAVANKTF
jgi:type VI protein secretion system component Hcp